MPDDTSLPIRVQILERSHAEFRSTTERNIERLEAAIADVRSAMATLGDRVDSKLDEMRNSIEHLRTDALNSLPPWAAACSERKSIAITLLVTLIGVLASGLVFAALHH